MKLRIARARGVDAAAVVAAVGVARAAGVGKRRPSREQHEDHHPATTRGSLNLFGFSLKVAREGSLMATVLYGVTR